MNLVIVESPNKTQKISKILGMKVMASMGHIRDLPKKSLGIDNKYQATYEITKNKVVTDLRKAASKAKVLYIATDPDREGDGIAWHIQDVLKHPDARRMTFHEITKKAILKALEEANRDGKMDMNSVHSYQARRFIDRITGFKASPILWQNITGAKSAGRVQSVTTRLIIDREEKIKNHKPEEKYVITGLFHPDISAYLQQTPTTREEALQVLEYCKEANFFVAETNKKNVKHSPPPAFKTSVYQQEAGKRYGISPKDSMRIAQSLFEKGYITYHRTDTTRLSDEFQEEAKKYILEKYGQEYLGKEVKNTEKGAHEAIRPTDIYREISLEQKERLMYRMIWVRAIASLMAQERCERYTIKITLSSIDKYWFIANCTITIFPGFKILTETKESTNKGIISLKENDTLTHKKIESKQTFTEPMKRYTESSLVKDLEKKGIGRPSTYANIVTTIQLRKYVLKQKESIVKKECFLDVLEDKITSKKVKVDFGDKKLRLFPTDLGTRVTDFLVKNFHYMMDYTYTSNLEKELDEISKGNKNWIETVDDLNKRMDTITSKFKKDKSIGKYKGFTIEVFTGKYGPFVKYKSKCYSLQTANPSLEEAIQAITKQYLVSHDCKIDGKEGKIQGVRGPYGLYLKFVPNKGKPTNYFLPKELKENEDAVKNLSLEDCLKQVEFVKNRGK
jgi:DNA topoisomerase-1